MGNFNDCPSTFRALRGTRLKSVFRTLTHGSTLPLLWLLGIYLGALRYVNKFDDASSRSTRAKAENHGHAKRPPMLDLTNPAFDPHVATLQFLSCLCHFDFNDADDCRRVPLFRILLEFTDKAPQGEWSRSDLEHRMRTGSVCVSAAMISKTRRFKQMPLVLARTVDPEQPWEEFFRIQRDFLYEENVV